MRRFMRRFRKSFRYGEKGFTLIELLIVVAILGILAAVVVPNVGTFLESGKVGAGRAERATLQVGVDGMMADAGASVLSANVTGWNGNDTGVVTVTVGTVTYDARDYLRRAVAANSLWDVDVNGIVACTQYDNSTEADFIAKINQ